MLIAGCQTTQLMGVHVLCKNPWNIIFHRINSWFDDCREEDFFSVAFLVLEVKRFKQIVTLTAHYWITGMHWI